MVLYSSWYLLLVTALIKALQRSLPTAADNRALFDIFYIVELTRVPIGATISCYLNTTQLLPLYYDLATPPL